MLSIRKRGETMRNIRDLYLPKYVSKALTLTVPKKQTAKINLQKLKKDFIKLYHTEN